MYCPTCGSEERQRSQYCRGCGTDLRIVRIGLERPDAITASAVSARDHVGRAIADKIRNTHSVEDLQKVAEEVLPEIEKFLESPEERRLRRIRFGVVFASIGLGATILALILSLIEEETLPFLGVALAFFFLGIGIVINGLAFTVPRKRSLPDPEANLPAELGQVNNTAALFPESARELPTANSTTVRPSVTEHTTHHLK
ncbi:MAG TPA: zinc ribbon domain-containing protein [Pyrinomonadaceae bacterium]|nr:zinc ribbon domain-containing protein [Pyrinomonadaceae bacterium]